MGDDIIMPSGGGGATDATRKAVGGWHAMMEARKSGKSDAELKRERLLKENTQRAEEIRSGKPAKEEGFRPGEDTESDGFNMRKARLHMQKLTEQKQSQMVYKGNAQQIALKLQVLTEGDAELNIKGGKLVKVISCESAGMGAYKLTYVLLSE